MENPEIELIDADGDIYCIDTVEVSPQLAFLILWYKGLIAV